MAAEIPQRLTCCACKQEKSFLEFYADKRNASRGFRAHRCKPCAQELKRESRKAPDDPYERHMSLLAICEALGLSNIKVVSRIEQRALRKAREILERKGYCLEDFVEVLRAKQ
jgi:hypothetical protein